MKKPTVVLDSDKARFIDLGNGTTEIWDKTKDKKLIVENSIIRAELIAMKAKKMPLDPVTAYKHKGN